MFEGDTNIGLLNVARNNQYTANRNAQQSDLNLAAYYRARDRANVLEQENAALRARVAELEAEVETRTWRAKATNEAWVAERAAWRSEHPVSSMNDTMGVLGDGRPIKRNLHVWITTFDAAARKRGITNPEAHRIS